MKPASTPRCASTHRPWAELLKRTFGVEPKRRADDGEDVEIRAVARLQVLHLVAAGVRAEQDEHFERSPLAKDRGDGAELRSFLLGQVVEGRLHGRRAQP